MLDGFNDVLDELGAGSFGQPVEDETHGTNRKRQPESPSVAQQTPVSMRAGN